MTLPNAQALVRDKWYPAYNHQVGDITYYMALMPRAVEADGELPDNYIRVLADPKYKPTTAVRFLDAIFPFEIKPVGTKIVNIGWGRQPFFIGEKDECLTFIGRAQPCVNHDQQLNYKADDVVSIKGGYKKPKHQLHKDKCPGAHFYFINKKYQKFVLPIAKEYTDTWEKINEGARYEGQYSIYLLRSEETNSEDIKTLITIMNKYPGWALQRLKNGFNLFYTNRDKTVMRKPFYVTKIYDAIDFIEAMNPVYAKFTGTRDRD